MERSYRMSSVSFKKKLKNKNSCTVEGVAGFDTTGWGCLGFRFASLYGVDFYLTVRMR